MRGGGNGERTGGHGHRGAANYPADRGLIVFPTLPALSPMQGQVLAAPEGVRGAGSRSRKGEGE